MKFSKPLFRRHSASFRLESLLKYTSFAQGLFGFFLFEEPPYFTAEPESRISVEVEASVDIACGAMGECGEGAGQWWEGRDAVALSRAELPPLEGLLECDG